MAKLPEDVALEVASKLQDMARINGIKKFHPYHIDAACKIVQCYLLHDTIQWCRYMRGESYE